MIHRSIILSIICCIFATLPTSLADSYVLNTNGKQLYKWDGTYIRTPSGKQLFKTRGIISIAILIALVTGNL
ncbi:hypothetical protein OAF65_06225 [Verrucomicrobiales bacterium]|nr:hypothetical protein [Verrucomicrobiales bacterium]